MKIKCAIQNKNIKKLTELFAKVKPNINSVEILSSTE
jgi:hypothetical protein